MSGSPSVGYGGATITATGIYTGDAVSQVLALTQNKAAVKEIYGQNGVPPVPTVPAGEAGNYILVIPNNVSVGSAISVPAGYGAVMVGQGANASITGGDANTTVVSAGTLNYSGAAAVVAESGGTGTVSDSANGAILSFGGGSDSVTASGNNQAIRVDNGTVAVDATGTGDVFQFGDPTTTSQAAAVANAAGASSVESYSLTLAAGATGASIKLNSGNTFITDLGSANTVTGAAGAATIIAATNDVYFGAAASVEFVGAGTAQTVFGGTGNTTVFGDTVTATSIVDHMGSAQNTFVGLQSTATVFGGGTGGVFGGTGSTTFYQGNGNDTFVGGGGSDSVYANTGTSPTVFGSTNENLVVGGSHSAFEVALGTNDVINASGTEGGNNFFAISSSGNTTLSGAIGGAVDTYNFVNTGGGTAHTVTISNWHTGDGLFLAGYGSADVQAMDTAINGGKSTFTLSDGTTVTFQGAAPQHAIGSGAF